MLQEPIIFRATAFENIAWGSRNADPAKVREAARRTEAESFIQELPQGYDTILGQDGSTLSGGQRQRLALARALVRDAPIVDPGRADQRARRGHRGQGLARTSRSCCAGGPRS